MQVTATRDRTQRFVLAQFAKGQHRDKDMARFLKAAVPVVLASRRQISALTDSYLSQTLTKQLGRPVRPRGPIDTDALRGVPAEDVYQRPYQTVWTKLSEGLAYEAAIAAATARLGSIVLTDMQMAKTYTSREVLSSTDNIVGYNRVPSGGKSCDLCLIAAQNTYHIGDLLPIHDNCNCDVEPIVRDSRRDATTVPDVSDPTVEIAVHHNSEIGPILAVMGHAFTGPSDLAA